MLFILFFLGCEKLGISTDGCKVVLEEDGSEIDDDEILQEFVSCKLMILKQDEEWLSESEQKQVAVSKTTDKGNSLALRGIMFKILSSAQNYVRAI